MVQLKFFKIGKFYMHFAINIPELAQSEQFYPRVSEAWYIDHI